MKNSAHCVTQQCSFYSEGTQSSNFKSKGLFGGTSSVNYCLFVREPWLSIQPFYQTRTLIWDDSANLRIILNGKFHWKLHDTTLTS